MTKGQHAGTFGVMELWHCSVVVDTWRYVWVKTHRASLHKGNFTVSKLENIQPVYQVTPEGLQTGTKEPMVLLMDDGARWRAAGHNRQAMLSRWWRRATRTKVSKHHCWHHPGAVTHTLGLNKQRNVLRKSGRFTLCKRKKLLLREWMTSVATGSGHTFKHACKYGWVWVYYTSMYLLAQLTVSSYKQWHGVASMSTLAPTSVSSTISTKSNPGSLEKQLIPRLRQENTWGWSVLY